MHVIVGWAVVLYNSVVMLHNKELTEAVVAATKRSFLTDLAQRCVSTTTLPRLVATPLYRDIEVKDVPVTSPMDLLNAHLESFIRGDVVNHGLIAKLWFEDALVTQKTPQTVSIAPSLLVGGSQE